MKNYIKPSVEMSTFDAPSIMALSGTVSVNTVADFDALTNEVYRDYLNANGGEEAAAANGYVELTW